MAKGLEHPATINGCTRLAGYATYKIKFWFSVHKEANSYGGLNLQEVEEWKELPTKSVLMLEAEDQVEVKEAKV